MASFQHNSPQPSTSPADTAPSQHTQPAGRKPLIELEPADHPLAVEQRNGITWQRV
jgi:hypothetical protein